MHSLPAEAAPELATLRDQIDAIVRQPEAKCVQALISQAWSGHVGSVAIAEQARAIVTQAKRNRPVFSLGTLTACYPLSSPHGLALLSLAEALLRIPDAPTMRLLATEALSGQRGGWTHTAHATLGWPARLLPVLLDQAARLLERRELTDAVMSGARHALHAVARQFVFAPTLPEALTRAAAQRNGYNYSFDMLGEAAQTQQEADDYFAAYESALHAVGRHPVRGGRDGISVKLSALHPRYAMAQRERVLRALRPRLERLITLARDYGIGLTIDAEEADRLGLSLDLVAPLVRHPLLGDYSGFGLAVQAYQKCCPKVIDYLVALARAAGVRLSIRLVKGAYWDTEIKHTQVSGLSDYPVFTRKTHTDLSWLVCAQKLMQAHDAVVPQFATHHALGIGSVMTWARERHLIDMEFQCLHGMGEPVYDALVEAGTPCRIYAPIGPHAALLPYLVRRLMENGARLSFLHQVGTDSTDLAALLTDPFAEAGSDGGASASSLPLPAALFGAVRINSRGEDLSSLPVVARIESAIRHARATKHLALPTVHNMTTPGAAPMHAILNPAEPADVVGYACNATDTMVCRALRQASAEPVWRAMGARERATVLAAAADRLATERDTYIALLVREAGKCIPAAIAEIREAEDALRYDAAQAMALDDAQDRAAGTPLGIVVCISPWNFPLAIFMGQIGAALAAGNVVLAKPAAQTPLVAAEAVRLLHAAGVPADALQLLPGPGDVIGHRLVADPRVAGVLFTGSTAVANAIARALVSAHARDTAMPVFVAETGGQNAMIVDSSALPEQVVQDVLASAFDSAGQRCSALRLLCLQDDIAGPVLAKLKGAMEQLVVGDPATISTDVGPVIDARSADALRAYVDGFRRRGRVLAESPISCASANMANMATMAHLVAPVLVQVDQPSDLQREIFGPVLHVLRYPADQLDDVLKAIHAGGHGLTMGLHSRLTQRIAQVAATAPVGNFYVNRNMIGAVIGVQPFGGEGKSGTGPKAGGPFLIPSLQRNPNARALHRQLASLTRRTGNDDDSANGGGHDDHERIGPSLRNALVHARERLGALETWCRQRGGADVADRCRDYANTTPLGLFLHLPGPTGERNTLQLFPRERIACCALHTGTLLQALVAVLATGNRAILDHYSGALLPPDLPGAVRDCIDTPDPDDFLLDNRWLSTCRSPFLLLEAGRLKDLHPWTATAWPDDLPVPQILTFAHDPIPLWRLMVERAVCINTVAVGGNPALLDARPAP